MRLLKDSNPIELVEYAVANRIQDEPAFKWWVPCKLGIESLARSRVGVGRPATSMAFGCHTQFTKHCRSRKETGTDFWWQAIQKEMKNKVMIAFEYDNTLTQEQARTDKSKYVGFQETTWHIMFDVIMDITRKVRFVAGGHLTEPPASITYSSVLVSCSLVCTTCIFTPGT